MAHVQGSSSEAHAKAGDHDALVKWLSAETALGRSVLGSMESDGYAVLPGVLSRAECAIELEVRLALSINLCMALIRLRLVLCVDSAVECVYRCKERCPTTRFLNTHAYTAQHRTP